MTLLIGGKLGLSRHILTLRTVDLSDQVGEGRARLVVGLVEVD